MLKDDSYVTVASLVSRTIKKVFASTSRTVDRTDNVIMYEKEPIFCKKVSFTMYDLDFKGYFYHDRKRESDEPSDFHRKLSEKRSTIEKLQIRPNIRETIESIASHYRRYFTWRMAESRQKQGTMPYPAENRGNIPACV